VEFSNIDLFACMQELMFRKLAFDTEVRLEKAGGATSSDRENQGKEVLISRVNEIGPSKPN